MLIVFLMVFPSALNPGVVRNFGKVVLPPGVVGEGRCDVEGALSPLLGRLGVGASVLRLDVVGTLPVLLRVFIVGKAGNADVGGPYEGPDGRGIEAAMADDDLKAVLWKGRLNKRCKSLSVTALYQH